MSSYIGSVGSGTSEKSRERWWDISLEDPWITSSKDELVTAPSELLLGWVNWRRRRRAAMTAE